jgi:hypothetical protein
LPPCRGKEAERGVPNSYTNTRSRASDRGQRRLNGPAEGVGKEIPFAGQFDAFGQRTATGGSHPYHRTDKQFGGNWEYQTEWSDGRATRGWR